MITIGIDPDLHRTSIAVLDSGRITYVGVFRVANQFTGEVGLNLAVTTIILGIIKLSKEFPHDWMPDLFIVEGQQVIAGGAADYESILRLGQVAGAALCACTAQWPKAMARLPRPQEWTGSLPKHITQGRAWKSLGILFDAKGGKKPYCVPRLSKDTMPARNGTINFGDWLHISDAVALAVWGAKELEKQRAVFRAATQNSKSN